MKHIFTQLGAALIMLFALNINAQTLIGLPQYGVTLTGTIDHPVIQNASGRDILGYVLHFRQANGNGPVYTELTTAHIRRGQPVKTAIPWNRSTSGQPQSPGSPAVTSITVDAVIFADGQYVIGSQDPGVFQFLAVQIEAERGVGQMLASVRNNPAQQGAAWAKVYALSAVPASQGEASIEADFIRAQQHIVARDILMERKNRGDDAAFDMAERMGKLASVWRAK